MAATYANLVYGSVTDIHRVYQAVGKAHQEVEVMTTSGRYNTPLLHPCCIDKFYQGRNALLISIAHKMVTNSIVLQSSVR